MQLDTSELYVSKLTKQYNRYFQKILKRNKAEIEKSKATGAENKEKTQDINEPGEPPCENTSKNSALEALDQQVEPSKKRNRDCIDDSVTHNTRISIFSSPNPLFQSVYSLPEVEGSTENSPPL